MIKVISHSATEFFLDQSIKGTFTTPSGAKKLTGAMVISTSILNNRETIHNGFTLKLQVNNRKANPANNDFDGGKDYPEFENLTEDRITEFDCELNPTEKNHYCIICKSDTIMEKQDDGSTPETELKLYLLFE